MTIELSARPAWHAFANCRGISPDLMFPPEEGAKRADLAAARAVCEGCIVKQDCRAAGEREYFGFWGGTAPKERKAQRKRVVA